MPTLRFPPLAAALLLAALAPLRAQSPAPPAYPVAPSPVVDVSKLRPEVKLSGYLSVRWSHHDDSSTFSVFRARLTAQVAPRPNIAARFQVDLAGRLTDSTATGPVLTDAFLQLAPPDSFRAGRWRPAALHPALLVGQFRAPFSAEYLTATSILRTANRSVVTDRLSLKRDVGVMAQTDLGPFLRLSGAVLNGSGPNTTRNPDDKELAVGRLTMLPLAHTSVSAKWSGEGAEHRWGADARWAARGAILEGEWMRRRRAVRDVVSADARGGYALAVYKVVPWLEPLVKWERYTESTGAHERDTWMTYGLNLMTPSESVRLLTNWIVRREHPTDRPNDELLLQAVVTF